MSDDLDFRCSEQLNELSAALAKAQGEFPTIEKTKQGKVEGVSKKTGQKYSYNYVYADIADVLHGILPVLAKYGLSVIQPTIVRQGAIYIRTRLLHSSGQWLESLYPVSAIGGDHQAMGGALTYARRYALTALAGVASDEDTDRGEATAAATSQGQPDDSTDQLASIMVDGLNSQPDGRALLRLLNSMRWKDDFASLSDENKQWIQVREESRRQELGLVSGQETPQLPAPEQRPAGDAPDRSPGRQLERPRQPAVDDDIPF